MTFLVILLLVWAKAFLIWKMKEPRRKDMVLLKKVHKIAASTAFLIMLKCIHGHINVNVKINMQMRHSTCHFAGVTSDVLLYSNVTIIGSENCAKFLSSNVSSNPLLKARLRAALDSGVNDQLVCTIGDKNQETGVYAVTFHPLHCSNVSFVPMFHCSNLNSVPKPV